MFEVNGSNKVIILHFEIKCVSVIAFVGNACVFFYIRCDDIIFNICVTEYLCVITEHIQ